MTVGAGSPETLHENTASSPITTATLLRGFTNFGLLPIICFDIINFNIL